MEELILKLTQAINDFNKYLKNEYSSINKNFSGIGNSIGDYSIFTLVAPKLTDYKINKTFPRANYILVSINNSKDVIYLSVNALTKEKLAFRDGSKFEGIFSDLFLTYDFSGGVLPKVQIYIGYNSKYNPITSVKIADIDSSNPLPVTLTGGGIEEHSENYGVKTYSGNVNNSIVSISLPQTIDGRTVKGITSVLITNLDSSHDLFFGDIDDIANINNCTPIGAGEKFSIDFEPACISLEFSLASLQSVNFQYTILYAYEV